MGGEWQSRVAHIIVDKKSGRGTEGKDQDKIQPKDTAAGTNTSHQAPLSTRHHSSIVYSNLGLRH